MATAVRNAPQPIEPPPVTYTLTLSEREAKAIAALCRKVSGYPEKTTRLEVNEVGSALERASLGLIHVESVAAFRGSIEALPSPW